METDVSIMDHVVSTASSGEDDVTGGLGSRRKPW